VSSGPAALAALGGAKYDLLITDCHMPEMDGVELTRRVRDREAAQGTPRLPVLALSADVTQPMRERCLAAGIDDFIIKPVDLSRLQVAVVQIGLGHKAAREATETPVAAMVFDISTYQELFQDEPEMGRDWLMSYLDSAAASLRQIREALANGDRTVLKAKAHGLAGASLSAGATVLGGLCRDLEAVAPQASEADIKRRLDVMQGAFVAVRDEIVRFLPETVRA
jgi:CheY-like chemotaxis protein